MKVKITHNNMSVEYTNDIVFDYDFIKSLVETTISVLDEKNEKDALETFKLTEWEKHPQQ